MTCKDCVHYELCFDYTHLKHSKNLPDNREDVCEHFKNKAKFVELPCKVGDAVWFISDEIIIETKVDKIVLKNGGLYIKLNCNSMYETSCNSIGKTVFLTKEEAEQKSKGGADDD